MAMRLTVASILMSLVSHASAAAPSPLARYVDQARVLVLSAPAEADAELDRQLKTIARAAAWTKDRDLVTVRAVGGEARDDAGLALDAAALREALRLPTDRFEAVLSGKDRGVKLRRGTAIAPERIFNVIDAMPMRRDELRQRGR